MLTGSSSSVDVGTLLGLARFLTDTLDNVSAFPDASILALMNQEYRETQTFLLSEIMYDWKENTLNGTGSGLLNLVAGTPSVAFPTGLLTLDRVEINYTGGSNTWVEANPVKLESFGTAVSNIAGNAPVRYSTGNPKYWARDGRIYFDPVPPTSVTGGVKVWCTTLITDLIAGETAGPVFAAAFHPLIAMGAAKRYLQGKDQQSKADAIERDKLVMRQNMVRFYSGRQADEKPTIKPKQRCMQ